MRLPSKKILKTMLFTAAVSLIHGSAKANKSTTGLPMSSREIGDGDKVAELKNLNRKIIKNVYTLKKDGDVKLIADHRSHSSHSSHSSHRSGSGGGYGSHNSHTSHTSHRSSSYGGSSHYSSSYGGSSRYSSPSRNGYSSSSSKPSSFYSTPTIDSYSLGDRGLSVGSYGSDVSALTKQLVEKKYLNSSKIQKKSGYSLYDSEVAKAVKNFQKDAGLSQTGKCDMKTAGELMMWDASKTTIQLGIREISQSMEGYDVTELVSLLRKAGYPPNPAKIVKEGNKTMYTADVAMAVKMFQAYNGLQATGTADMITIEKLRAKGK